MANYKRVVGTIGFDQNKATLENANFIIEQSNNGTTWTPATTSIEGSTDYTGTLFDQSYSESFTAYVAITATRVRMRITSSPGGTCDGQTISLNISSGGGTVTSF